MQWATGLTTAPRGTPEYHARLLLHTINSVQKAGWYDITVFAEPESCVSTLPDGVALHQNTKRLGSWPNFLHALAILQSDSPSADLYVIFQDDIWVAKGCREWLDRELKVGHPSRLAETNDYILSLYTSHATRLPSLVGWFAATGRYRDPVARELLDPNWFGVGACAIALPRARVIDLLRNPPGLGCLTKTDYHLSEFCIDNDVLWLQHLPSLVSHRGKVSTLGQKWSLARQERAWISDLTISEGER